MHPGRSIQNDLRISPKHTLPRIERCGVCILLISAENEADQIKLPILANYDKRSTTLAACHRDVDPEAFETPVLSFSGDDLALDRRKHSISITFCEREGAADPVRRRSNHPVRQFENIRAVNCPQ